MDDTKRRVVCAANQYHIITRVGVDTVVITGVRHYCPLMIQNMKFWKSQIVKSSEIQGFVDQFGVFMDRFEALEVATNAGQINVVRPKTSPNDRLFSEDLY